MALIALDFLKQLECLKTTRRSGWKLRGIQDPESVADHSFMVTVMCMMMGDSVSQAHAILIHSLTYLDR